MRFFGSLMAASLAAASGASGAELLTNGGFETGSLAGWSVFTQGGSSGALFATDLVMGAGLPISGSAAAGPAAGDWYAAVDQGGPGAYSLSQEFTVSPDAVQVFLSFSMFHSDLSGAAPLNSGVLDYTAGPTQWARVDILDSLGAVLATYADVGSEPWAVYADDITALVTPGDTYTFRYGHVDNQFFYHTALDNASIVEVIPAPGAAALLGLAGFVVARRRR